MIRLRQFSLLSAIVPVMLFVSACEKDGGSAKGGSIDKIVQPLADNTPILEYNGGKINAKEVNEVIAAQIKKAQEDLVEAYQQGAKRMLVQKLLDAESKKRGQSIQQMMETLAAGPVTDQQVEDFLKSRPDLQKGFKDPKTGKTQKVSKEDIKRFLESQSRQGSQQSFVEGLLAQAQAHTVLELPKIQIEKNDKSPSLGSSSAKVTIYEFSDFQCPYCSRGKGVVHQIHDAYKDKVNIVYRNFPLDFHPEAKPSALAAICASEQGKFWEFHDKMFDNQKDLNEKNRVQWAKDVGLDQAKWEKCIADSSTQTALQKDLSAAEKAGVNSTPTFFVNGRKVAGALPFEEFKAIIDAELAK